MLVCFKLIFHRIDACHASNPLLPASDAHREAIVAETRIYDEAGSIDDYESSIDEKVASYPQRFLQFPTPEDTKYVPTPGAITVGMYQNALYYKEGLFSAIYKAPALNSSGGYFPDGAPARANLVALKITSPSMMEPPHDSRREAEILKKAASPNVIALIDTFREEGGKFVLVFPFMPLDLGVVLREGKFAKKQIKIWLKDLFSALAFIHQHGIIHRDIKPSNILLQSIDGPAYLADFGISWAPDTAGSEAPDAKITDVGTTCYRPPELLFGNKAYDCTLDLWAAGCTVAEIMDPDHPTLFDSGELGSDLALLQSIFKKLGTPTLTRWPEAAKFPDWGKMQFYDYPEEHWGKLLPRVSEEGQDLVSELVRYESGARMTALKALDHAYFRD
ncbi:mitogen-activated protein kinase [Didymella glomerata]|uniref:cyclin-dependent kinase n=1 Tax=Didymella glomerata TaxID=749621 RepID=A0A9W8X3I6_9PLEO|nr:mitogen-activated protein kinase [Didymella glomerata]